MIPADPAAAWGIDTGRNYLNLNAKNLAGDLPNLCAAFPNLKTLYLSDNPELTSGPVPSWVADCEWLDARLLNFASATLGEVPWVSTIHECGAGRIASPAQCIAHADKGTMEYAVGTWYDQPLGCFR